MRNSKDKTKRRQYRAQIRALKSSKRRKDWIKAKRKSLQGTSLRQRTFQETKRHATTVKAPVEFSINKKPNETFKFIALLKSYRKSHIKALFILLRDCTYISNGAIALMISAIKELKTFGIKVSGSYPHDKSVRTILEKSGFFNFVFGYVSEENKTTLNTIIQQGTDVVDAVAVAPLVLKAMNVVWGQPYRNPRLQSLLIELMANTVNHAFVGNKRSNWYLSMSINQSHKKVSFTFIDNGQGINRTLNVKFVEKIKSLFLSSDEEILKAAFDGKFGSRTRERKRGRGLPNVKKCFIENYISNLTVVANDVYYDFKSDSTKNLIHGFEGTCYYWELDLTCEPWKIL